MPFHFPTNLALNGFLILSTSFAFPQIPRQQTRGLHRDSNPFLLSRAPVGRTQRVHAPAKWGVVGWREQPRIDPSAFTPGARRGDSPFGPWDAQSRMIDFFETHRSEKSQRIGNHPTQIRSDSVREAWVRHYGSGRAPAPDFANDMVIDDSGNVYVAGCSSGSSTCYDYATVKYNAAGVRQWIARYNGPGNDYDEATAIAIDQSGNVYVTGSSWGLDMCCEYATVKYNAAGVEQWIMRRSVPESSDNIASDVAVDHSGNVYVTGASAIRGSSYDCVTIMYNAAGIEQWIAQYDGPGSGDDYAAALSADISGNVYLTGSSWSGTSDDYATIKYDAAGQTQWVARYNGPADSVDHAIALAIDDSGNVYVTGLSGGVGTGSDYATIKYNVAGSQQWIARYTGSGIDHDAAEALAIDDSGNVYVTGLSIGSRSSDYVTFKYNAAGVQLWTARYNGSGQGFDGAYDLVLDGMGNVFVTGVSQMAGSAVDYATIKYNAAGIQQWAARYNGAASDIDYPVALCVDRSGNVYATGVSLDLVTSVDYATVKYNPAGTEQWVTRYDGPGNSLDRASAIAVDASGNVGVTGCSFSQATDDDFATVKYDASGNLNWAAHYNGPGNKTDDATAIAIDASGNVYVTGYSMGSGTEADYATIKYNAAGVEQWVARYNGTQNLVDIPYALAIDNSGNVYVTGQSSGSGTQSDYATVKYNAAGVQQWAARYDETGNSDDYASALAVDDSGNVYVTGQSYSQETMSDFATVKYNAAGVERWAVRYNGEESSGDGATAIGIDGSGNVYVTGWSFGSGTSRDYATIKYNQAGVEQWVARYNGPADDEDEATSLAVSSSGDVYVTGYSVEAGTWCDYTTIKYNDAGVQQWVARYDGSTNDYDYPNDITTDNSDNVYVTGVSYNSGTEADFATVKYDPTGAEQWVARFNRPGSQSYDYAHALALDSSGSVYVAGVSEADVSQMFTTVKYVQTPTDVRGDEPAAPLAFRLEQNYPNPFNPITNLQFTIVRRQLTTLRVHDLLGRGVATLVNEVKQSGAYSVQWDASGLPSGVYFYRLTSGAQSLTRKLVLLR